MASKSWADEIDDDTITPTKMAATPKAWGKNTKSIVLAGIPPQVSDKLSSENKCLTVTVANLKTELSTKIDENKKLRVDKDNITIEFEKVQAENVSIKSELEKTQAENVNIKSEFEKAQAENAGVKSELEKAQAENAGVKSELEKVQAENMDIKSGLEKTRVEIAGIKSELTSNKNEFEKIKTENGKLKSVNDMQNARILKLEKTNKEIVAENSSLKAKKIAPNVERQIIEKDTEIRILKEQLLELRAVSYKMAAQIGVADMYMSLNADKSAEKSADKSAEKSANKSAGSE